MKIFKLIIVLSLCFTNCQTNKENKSTTTEKIGKGGLPVRPNILWLVAEDMGAYIPPFGDTTVATPNLSKLASEGVIYPY